MKIIIIEDHQLVRDMLMGACIDSMPGVAVAGAGTCAEGVALCRQRQPDLVLLDLVLPDGDGLDQVDAILAGAPRAKIIALTSHADEFTLHRALRAKVHGFVDKNEQPLRLLREAIATVLDGRPYFSSVAQRVQASLRQDPAAFNKLLSDREQELLRYFGEGLSNEEVAARVGLTAGTVKLHRRNIMGKLDVHSTPQLMRYALEKGFTRPRP
ncbi:MAG TPA: response regulator transcription factor [Opitutaceae bacterium]|nr:response regulator transcription factor [Opitutaceae bacterium]